VGPTKFGTRRENRGQNCVLVASREGVKKKVKVVAPGVKEAGDDEGSQIRGIRNSAIRNRCKVPVWIVGGISRCRQEGERNVAVVSRGRRQWGGEYSGKNEERHNTPKLAE